MLDNSANLVFSDPRMAFGEIAVDEGGAGVSIRDEPEGDLLEAEFRKFESGGAAAVDWKFLNDETLTVIQTRSKDLVLAARLVYGLYREEGYCGLAIGLAILQGMVSSHWDGLFPPVTRERARAGAFDWLAEKLAPAMEADEPDVAQYGAVIVANEKLLELDGLLEKKLQKHPAMLGPLMRALRPHVRRVRAELESPTAAESQPVTPAQAEPTDDAQAAVGDAGSTVIGQRESDPVAEKEHSPDQRVPPTALAGSVVPEIFEVSTDEGVETALKTLLTGVFKIASLLRQASPADPRSYSGTRFAHWGQFVAQPPSTAGKTALPPPRKEKLAEIAAVQATSNYQALLITAETAFVASPFWLDAQFLAAGAAARLGEEYAAVYATIVSQLRATLLRFPELPALKFSDGMPLASVETRNWISTEVMVSGVNPSAGAVSRLDEVAVEGDKLGQNGQVVEGLRLLNQHADACVSAREQFQARLKLGEYCLRFDLLQPLFALLIDLREIADRQDIDCWEPELSIELAVVSWLAINHKNAGRHFDEQQRHARKEEAIATLTRLDFVKAAELSVANV